MTYSWEMPLAVIGGALAGLGVFLIVRQILPAVFGVPAPPVAGRRELALRPTLVAGPFGWLTRWVTLPTRDLAVLRLEPEAYLARVAGWSLAGLIVPFAVAGGLALYAIDLPVALPVSVGLVAAGTLGLLAHYTVVRRAELARREFAHAFCTYLDLVVLELAAAGPVHAMERAARICQGWAFERIEEALLLAQVQPVLPWDQMRALGVEYGMVELQEFAAVMHTAGSTGGQAPAMLRAQAAALRSRLRADALGRATSSARQLELPATLLLVVLLLYAIYPLLTRHG